MAANRVQAPRPIPEPARPPAGAPLPPIPPHPCKSCNPCLPPFSFSACQRNSPLPGFRQNWCTFVPLSYHRSYRFHPTLALLLPPRRPIPGGTRNFTKGPAPRKHPPFALPLYIHPMSPVRTYILYAKPPQQLARPPPFHERYLGSPSNPLINAPPRVHGGSLNSLPGAHRHFRDHASIPHSRPYGVIAENRQQHPITPDDPDACFPLHSENIHGRSGRIFPTPYR